MHQLSRCWNPIIERNVCLSRNSPSSTFTCLLPLARLNSCKEERRVNFSTSPTKNIKKASTSHFFSSSSFYLSQHTLFSSQPHDILTFSTLTSSLHSYSHSKARSLPSTMSEITHPTINGKSSRSTPRSTPSLPRTPTKH